MNSKLLPRNWRPMIRASLTAIFALSCINSILILMNPEVVSLLWEASLFHLFLTVTAFNASAVAYLFGFFDGTIAKLIADWPDLKGTFICKAGFRIPLASEMPVSYREVVYVFCTFGLSVFTVMMKLEEQENAVGMLAIYATLFVLIAIYVAGLFDGLRSRSK